MLLGELLSYSYSKSSWRGCHILSRHVSRRKPFVFNEISRMAILVPINGNEKEEFSRE
jgi:hypothetical protein